MGLLQRFFSPKERKASAVGPAIASFNVGQPAWMPRRYDTMADEGYVKNVIAFRAVVEIASSAASVPWILMGKGDKEIEKHPLLDLLRKPNPMWGGATFFEGFISFYIMQGNGWMEANRGLAGTKPPKELWLLRPDRMSVIPSVTGLPQAYQHEVNGQKKLFPVDPITGKSNILHFRRFHPLNDWYGLGQIEPAAYSIDQHNQAGAHNQALLQNGVRPSGALIFKNNPGKESIELAQQMLTDRYTTPRNAAKPMVLGGDVIWEQMMLTAVEMDFVNSVAQVSRNIALAFGVPPMLLGIPGDNTYSNYAEARLALWEQTIIPTLDRMYDELNNWLCPMFGDGLTLKGDLDRVSALTPRREKIREAVLKEYQGGIITLNEAREALDYEDIDDGDTTRGQALGLLGLSKGNPETKAVNYRDLDRLASEIDEPGVYANVNDLVEAVLGQLVKKFGNDVVEEIGDQLVFDNTDRVKNFVRRRSAQLVTKINDTTRRRLRDLISDASQDGLSSDELAESIEDMFEKFGTGRSKVIAQTESTHVAGFSSQEAMTQAGISQKEWLSTADQFTRDSHAALDGQVVPSEGKFRSSSGAEAEFPGAFGIAEEDINCRCASAPVFEEGKSVKARSPEERKELWMKREEKRRRAEVDMVKTMRRVFEMQKEAVLTRLRALAG